MSLMLTPPLVPVLHPRDVGPLKKGHAARLALVTLDVRSTGHLYFSDGSENPDSQAYWVGMAASLLDDTNRPVPFDAVHFRVYVPGYKRSPLPIHDLAGMLDGTMVVLPPDLDRAERARIQAKQIEAEEPHPYPSRLVPIGDYDPDDPEEGLSPQDAQRVIHAYLSRHEGGTVVASDDVRHHYAMIDRIGLSIDVIPNVYHRYISMHGFFLRGLLGQLSGMTAIPSLADVVALPPGQERDALSRARHLAEYLRTLYPGGTLGKQILIPEEASAGEVPAGEVGTAAFEILNTGTTPVSARVMGSPAPFEREADAAPVVIPAGEARLVEVPFAPQEEGEAAIPLQITHDGMNRTSPAYVVLRGTGV